MTDSPASATRDWSVEAVIRIVADHASASVSPIQERHFRAGEECLMVQWGPAGRPVERDAWWTGYDIDGAFIVPAAKVEVLRHIRAACPNCPHSAGSHDELGGLVETVRGDSPTWVPEQCECCESWGGLPAPRDDAELLARVRMEDER